MKTSVWSWSMYPCTGDKLKVQYTYIITYTVSCNNKKLDTEWQVITKPIQVALPQVYFIGCEDIIVHLAFSGTQEHVQCHISLSRQSTIEYCLVTKNTKFLVFLGIKYIKIPQKSRLILSSSYFKEKSIVNQSISLWFQVTECCRYGEEFDTTWNE